MVLTAIQTIITLRMDITSLRMTIIGRGYTFFITTLSVLLVEITFISVRTTFNWISITVGIISCAVVVTAVNLFCVYSAIAVNVADINWVFRRAFNRAAIFHSLIVFTAVFVILVFRALEICVTLGYGVRVKDGDPAEFR